MVDENLHEINFCFEREKKIPLWVEITIFEVMILHFSSPHQERCCAACVSKIRGILQLQADN